MFAPDRCPDPPPIPLEHIDVMRYSKTDLENQDEKAIDDVWDGSDSDERMLSDWWVGETSFKRYSKAPKGYLIIGGRKTRIQKTTRPDTIWPEVWDAMSRKDRNKEILKRWLGELYPLTLERIM